jgi:hypothetical protein
MNKKDFISFDLTEYRKKQIITFLKTVKKFCKERDISFNLNSFFTYKTDDHQYIPDCYKYVLDAPAILLCASKSYKKFYYSLDPDFQQDIQKPNIKLLFDPANKQMSKILADILKKDFTLNK